MKTITHAVVVRVERFYSPPVQGVHSVNLTIDHPTAPPSAPKTLPSAVTATIQMVRHNELVKIPWWTDEEIAIGDPMTVTFERGSGRAGA